MSLTQKVALVTGGNKGIGLYISKQLAELKYKVILCSRDVDSGLKARDIHFSKNEHPLRSNIDVVQLDINNQDSINSITDYVQSKYGSIHTLINNAGISFKSNEFDLNVIQKTLETNFYGTINLTESLLPHINDTDTSNARIIFVSSRSGALLKYPKLRREQFLNPRLTQPELYSILDDFQNDAQKAFNTDEQKAKDILSDEYGWPASAYTLSKTGISMYSRLLAHDLWLKQRRRVFVAAYCPGYVASDMTNHSGERSVAEGAYGATILSNMLLDFEDKLQGDSSDSLLPFDVPNGAFWSVFFQRPQMLETGELEIIDWTNPQKTMSWNNLLSNMVIGADVPVLPKDDA